MIDYEDLVKEFMYKHGQKIQKVPAYPPSEIIDLRDRLIREEAKEFIDAFTLVDIADAIADLLYVTFGAALAYGIPIEEVFREVHRSNMTKPTKQNEFGKVLKGDYSPADIKSIIEGTSKPTKYPEAAE